MARLLLAFAVFGIESAVGLEPGALGCRDSTSPHPGTSLLQHVSRRVLKTGKVKQTTPDPTKSLEWAVQFDVNGHACAFCGLPPAERAPNNSYVQRTDCGNQTLFEHPDKALLPLSSFVREATEEHNETFGWCELNVAKGCADAIYNRDYMLFAKSIQIQPLPIIGYKTMSWDFHYCSQNGWLSPEVRALQHNFKGMTAKAKEHCNSDHLVKLGSKGNMTYLDMVEHYLIDLPVIPGNTPSKENSHWVAAWACGMGSAACDMAYCAYTYCKKEDGSFGLYDECPGWDPVKGMPVD
ncbi:unnamed protein product [Symbiodinium pilosum]|uniref:Uncharacterized protein n=1 Tax=Symbiodinium pilosum TaxID=2952 RepID=A0A812X1C6_SYMPI|nr:unnamed protein product [Symbiodinium pilosum]